VTRETALARIQKLLALAATGSGASEEEARTAAVQAARMMSEHGLAPGTASAGTSAIDPMKVADLALQVMGLEQLLAERRAQHLEEISDVNRRWRQVVEGVRREERAAARAERRKATRRAVTQDRTDLARSGGRARDRKLTHEQKTEIARRGAAARWARWREARATAGLK
jgi:hypothetical protein